MAINFPDSPTIGDEFTGGGFTWIWNGASWEKQAQAAAGTNGFSLIVGTSGNTTYTFPNNQSVGSYSYASDANDTSFDIYFITSGNQNAGYANASTSSIEATAEFDTVVVYGATANDVINFEYRPSSSPSAIGDMDGGAAPFITSATPTTLADIDSTTTVTGGNFATDVEIVFTGQDAVDRPAKNIVRSSSTSLIVTRPDDFPPDQEPYGMTATNPGISSPSTNVHKINNYFDAGGVVTWLSTQPALLASPQVGQPYSETVQAVDADGTGVSYEITAGSIAAGLSLNSSTGEISGTPTADGSYVFTITATDLGGNSASKEFNFSVAAATDTVASVLIIAGGGSGGAPTNAGGGGGAGGYREFSGFAFPGNQPLPISVGAGGSSNSNGTNTTLYNLSASGGGYGAEAGISSTGNSGGSGGGGTNYYGNGGAGNIGGYDPVEGYAGGRQSSYLQAYPGAGGGGAAEPGEDGTGAKAGSGGSGRESSITGTAVFRGGGGAGGVRINYPVGTAGVGGGGAENNPGSPNTGGGGGGRGQDASSYNTNGGSGVVILRYPSNRVATFSGGVTQTTTVDGSYKVSVVTATSTGSETVQFGVA